MSVFKGKEKKNWHPYTCLRMTNRRYIFEGKVIKEEEFLEYREDPSDLWWSSVPKNDSVMEITDRKHAERLGLEVATDE